MMSAHQHHQHQW